MKLYTEEQVRDMMEDSFNFGGRAIDYALSRMTPIELPSDEEIYGKLAFHAHGAKWVINRIEQQTKQQDNENT